jgi:hypothetical protein
MERFTIRIVEDETGYELCALCGGAQTPAGGPGLFLAESEDPVCRACGKRQAPELIALLDLARSAQRLGRVCRHTLVPPMESLLALARAAEEYAHSSARPLQRVA